jgi:hypothetical protein
MKRNLCLSTWEQYKYKESTVEHIEDTHVARIGLRCKGSAKGRSKFIMRRAGVCKICKLEFGRNGIREKMRPTWTALCLSGPM